MTTLAEETTRVVLDGEVVVLGGDELEQLLQTLAGLEPRAAESVAEQIAALRLAGGTIDLTPTEAELAALRLALEVIAGSKETGPGLVRLAAICGVDGTSAAIGAV